VYIQHDERLLELILNEKEAQLQEKGSQLEELLLFKAHLIKMMKTEALND